MANGINGNGSSNSFWPQWNSNRLFTLILSILGAYAIVWLGSLIWLNTLRAEHVGIADQAPAIIVVDGTGRITGTPTIATASLGLQTTGKEVASVQKENSEKMNAFIDALKQLKIPGGDIQTADYSVYPQYRYDQGSGKSTIDGYTVNQSVAVKIRDLGKISAVLGKAGELGLNQVSGVNFTIDDPVNLQTEARAKALAQVNEKAIALAKSLGVRLVRVVGFSEDPSSSSPGPLPMYAEARGGGPNSVPPTIESGSLDVVSNVHVMFQIQ